jgi:hypothetical protein
MMNYLKAIWEHKKRGKTVEPQVVNLGGGQKNNIMFYK